jgi:hypothetical protein
LDGFHVETFRVSPAIGDTNPDNAQKAAACDNEDKDKNAMVERERPFLEMSAPVRRGYWSSGGATNSNASALEFVPLD